MHAFATAHTVTPDDFDNWFRAVGELRTAMEIVDAAAAAFAGLADDTGWEARGVRALHDAIVASRWEAERSRGELHARLVELDRVGML